MKVENTSAAFILHPNIMLMLFLLFKHNTLFVDAISSSYARCFSLSSSFSSKSALSFEMQTSLQFWFKPLEMHMHNVSTFFA